MNPGAIAEGVTVRISEEVSKGSLEKRLKSSLSKILNTLKKY